MSETATIDKKSIIEMMGGSINDTAENLGCSVQNVYQWGDPVSQKVASTVLAHKIKVAWPKLSEKEKRKIGITEDLIKAANRG